MFMVQTVVELVRSQAANSASADVAGGEGEHGADTVGIFGLQLEAVEREKKLGADKGGTFVAIDERVIAGDAEAVGGRQAQRRPASPS